jgi:uncharacterized protein (DUF58 family)
VPIPTGRLLLLFAGPLLLAALAALWPEQLTLVLIADAVVAGIILLDALTLPGKRRLLVERKGAQNLSVGATNRFSLTVHNGTRRRVWVELRESFPATMALQGLPVAGWVKGRDKRVFAYEVVPGRRGAYDVQRTYLRVASLLGLWTRQHKRNIPHPMKVLPDVKILGTYALLARRNRIDLMGFRQTRGRGSDIEFDRLREYQRDDDYRRIDPFASARYRKLITREYQVSRNQNIVFMVDCGRPMAGQSGGLSTLDHALNAALMLSHMALEQGDNVGLLAFDHKVRKVLPLSSGLRSKTAMLYSLYDVRVSESESDYEQAFITLQRRVRQRSLVVLMTNVMDAASFALLAPQLKVLTRRHLPLVMLMRDADLFALADEVPQNVPELFSIGAAAELCTWREQMASQIQRMGALVLDIPPGQATPDLINTYLRIKADQLL